MPDQPKSMQGPHYFVRSRHLGALQTLLLRACQRAGDGFVSIPLLAEQVGKTRSALYRWIDKSRIPARVVPLVLENSQGRIDRDDLAPFVDH